MLYNMNKYCKLCFIIIGEKENRMNVECCGSYSDCSNSHHIHHTLYLENCRKSVTNEMG